MPESGPYGPLAWSYPRPWTLLSYAVLNVALAVHFTLFIAEGQINAPELAAGLIVLYFVWRGSKLAWGVAIAIVVVYLVISIVQVVMATEPGGHHPVVHVIEAALLLAMLVLLVVPDTRRFYDLQARGQQATSR